MNNRTMSDAVRAATEAGKAKEMIDAMDRAKRATVGLDPAVFKLASDVAAVSECMTAMDRPREALGIVDNEKVTAMWQTARQSARRDLQRDLALPINLGPTMSDLMDRQDRRHAQRHQEQLAEVRRLADAADASAAAAKESERVALESLAVAKRSLMWTRLALIISGAGLAIAAWVYLVPLPT